MDKTIENNDVIKQIEKEKDRFVNSKIEKNLYLGEYKERVLVALTKEEVEERQIYKEVEDALRNKEAKKIILSRRISLDKLKKYIKLSNELKIPYKISDALTYIGKVALVVVSDKAIENQIINPIVKSKLDKIREHGLGDAYFNALGRKISKEHLEKIRKEIPELADEYEELSIWDKLFGLKCPITEKLGGDIDD